MQLVVFVTDVVAPCRWFGGHGRVCGAIASQPGRHRNAGAGGAAADAGGPVAKSGAGSILRCGCAGKSTISDISRYQARERPSETSLLTACGAVASAGSNPQGHVCRWQNIFRSADGHWRPMQRNMCHLYVGVVQALLSAFVFGFHVHEKAILTVSTFCLHPHRICDTTPLLSRNAACNS